VSHVSERPAVYAFTAYGGSVSFTDPRGSQGGEDGDFSGAIQPHFFTCVPRLLEKVYENFCAKGMALKGPKRWIFFPVS
jgi:long-chain acyl-CoA synthetase